MLRSTCKRGTERSTNGQYQLEAGIKHFGDQGEIAVTKELQEFNMYGVFEPKSADELTDDDKKNALASLIFLKEKKTGTLKLDHAQTEVNRENISQRRKLLC